MLSLSRKKLRGAQIEATKRNMFCALKFLGALFCSLLLSGGCGQVSPKSVESTMNSFKVDVFSR